ncbi:pyridoxal phosphate-dependent aminotransferase [Sphingosinicella microcystinivorans]|uniref:Aminotransferase n=1 Tax=Sphingosinicella microcystinivorans TaxID=335406 RepID=A0AAD1D3D7_SPHMI|nr:pyridoxal phosphate-dependent aminotransferase [Sphingosinicella microcystinivorans]RKS88888.1 aspartate/methionine/tyrosine aminotransferase [Sphingosinicella microcystinivorans]BBE32643.1 aminotransferase [Sphingosinicella microcystinivorans]
MRYVRMPIEVESPEEYGYGNIRYNLSESSITDQTLSSLGLSVPDLTLLYGEHRGGERLRTLIAADAPSLKPDDVLVCGGAATALFIIATALLGPGDHLVVIRPNYATNLETPRAIGCAISLIDLKFEDGFRIDIGRIAAAITPRTKIISVTCPHNPTGTMLSEAELRQLVDLARENGCKLLVDETYRELSYGGMLPLAASLGVHVISVSSLSKAFGVPGIRIGWLITTDPALQELFLAAKEQISICGSVVDEWIAEQVLSRRAALLTPTLDEMRARLDLVSDWMAGEPLLEWVKPSGGVVCFPRMRDVPHSGTDGFYKRLLEAHGTYVGPGHWFEMPDTHFRLGYGWTTRPELEAGLNGISKALRGT